MQISEGKEFQEEGPASEKPKVRSSMSCVGKATKGPEQSDPEGNGVEETMIGSLKTLELNVKFLDSTVHEMESHYRMLTCE